MAQETKQTQGQLPCTTGCGFYGNPRNDGMCSVCYKDFLQRQNSNGRASPQVSSATVSSIGESLLAQCSEGRTVDVPSATPHTDADTGHSSVAVSQSLSTHSGEETTTGAKVGLKTEELQGGSSAAAAAAVGSGQEESSTASSSGTRSHSQDRKSGRSPPLEEGSRRGKRKLDDHHEPDGERASVSASEDSDQVSVDGLEDKSSDDKPKAKKNRCFTCRKKLGLTGFDCRCGNVFCGMHRYSDIHNCTFDYKADAAEKIRRENPVCVGEKIQKI